MEGRPATTVAEIIAAFGGLSKTARALGHRNVTTVDGWKRSNRIPRWRRHEILAAAARAGVALPAWFVAADEPLADKDAAA